MNTRTQLLPFLPCHSGAQPGPEPAHRPCSWRDAVPVLTGEHCVLRELQAGDAPPLLPVLTAPDVARFMSPPPTTVERFAWFIEWSRREREAGRYLAFALVPHAQSSPVGLLQLRQLEPEFRTAEWGVAMAVAVLGRRAVSRRRAPAARLCVQRARRAPPRSAGGAGQRPQPGGDAQARRRAGRRAAPLAHHGRWTTARSGALVAARRRLAAARPLSPTSSWCTEVDAMTPLTRLLVRSRASSSVCAVLPTAPAGRAGPHQARSSAAVTCGAQRRREHVRVIIRLRDGVERRHRRHPPGRRPRRRTPRIAQRAGCRRRRQPHSTRSRPIPACSACTSIGRWCPCSRRADGRVRHRGRQRMRREPPRRWDGSGVGVAMIDSGVVPHHDLGLAGANNSRPRLVGLRRFRQRTDDALRRLRSRHARGRHHRRRRHRLGRRLCRRRAGRQPAVAQGARRIRPRHDQHRHPGDRLRHREPHEAQHPRHQPLGRRRGHRIVLHGSVHARRLARRAGRASPWWRPPATSGATRPATRSTAV